MEGEETMRSQARARPRQPPKLARPVGRVLLVDGAERVLAEVAHEARGGRRHGCSPTTPSSTSAMRTRTRTRGPGPTLLAWAVAWPRSPRPLLLQESASWARPSVNAYPKKNDHHHAISPRLQPHRGRREHASISMNSPTPTPCSPLTIISRMSHGGDILPHR